MFSQPRVNHERINSLPIPIKSTTSMESFCNSIRIEEYSLKQNVFDPFKSSPPNDFLIKLQTRMLRYNSFCKMDDMRDSE